MTACHVAISARATTTVSTVSAVRVRTAPADVIDCSRGHLAVGVVISDDTEKVGGRRATESDEPGHPAQAVAGRDGAVQQQGAHRGEGYRGASPRQPGSLGLQPAVEHRPRIASRAVNH